MIVTKASARYRPSNVPMGGSLGDNMRQVQPPPPAALLPSYGDSRVVHINDPEARRALGDSLDFDDPADLQSFVDHVLLQFRLLRTWAEAPLRTP
jgi:hypothetical protein